MESKILYKLFKSYGIHDVLPKIQAYVDEYNKKDNEGYWIELMGKYHYCGGEDLFFDTYDFCYNLDDAHFMVSRYDKLNDGQNQINFDEISEDFRRKPHSIECLGCLKMALLKKNTSI